MQITGWIGRLFNVNNERNKILRNNILLSGGLKCIGLLTSLLIVPVTIHYLNNEVYGIWMTINSMLYWINVFDIGLGNGMRNYLTASISRGDWEEGRKYVTTTFVFLSVIALALFLIVLGPMKGLDYNRLLNTTQIANSQLRSAFMVAVVFSLCTFVLKNIGYIFVALQKYALNDMLGVLGNVLSLIVIFILTHVTKGNLMYVVLAYTAIPVLVFVVAAIPVFHYYPQLRPNRRSFDLSIGKVVVEKGLGFFIIQLTSLLVIFGAANFFIAQFCGPSQVTVYSLAYRYFNLLIIGFTILLAPMWNAYTDAYVKHDYQWISNTFRRSLKLWTLLLIVGVMMLGFSGLFYKLWVGSQVSVPFTVSLCTFIYVSCFNLNNCATYLINGLNKIRVQMFTSVGFTAIYIVMVNILGRHAGIEGVVLSMAACYAAMAFIHLYQCRLLISGRARGIWNK